MFDEVTQVSKDSRHQRELNPFFQPLIIITHIPINTDRNIPNEKFNMACRSAVPSPWLFTQVAFHPTQRMYSF